MKNKNLLNRIVISVIMTIAFIATVFLFYSQSITVNDRYDSDFPAHIQRAVNSGGKGYSLEGKLIVFFESIMGSTFGISLFLAVIVILTPFAASLLLLEIDDTDDMSIGFARGLWIGLWSVFTGPLVIPYIWPWFYKNAMNINAWHNSTSMEMRLFSILALIFYFRIQNCCFVRNEGIKDRDWIGLSVTLFISTWFKPSFFIGFAPVMAIWLLIDFILHSKEKNAFRKVVIIGIAAVPAGCMVLFQYWKLYASRENVSLAINTSANNFIYFVRIVLFLITPASIFIYNRKKVMNDYKNGKRAYIQIWMIWIFEVVYHLLLTEIGRSGGNFGWGVRIGNYLVSIVSVRLFWCNMLKSTEKKKQGKRLLFSEKIYLCVVCIMLLWELACGMYYFLRLLNGDSYYF